MRIGWLATAGEEVKEGEVIVKFDSSTAQQQVMQKEAQLRQAEATLVQAVGQGKITAQQEPAWQAFAAKASERAKAMQALHTQHQQTTDAKAAAPDRMAQHIADMQQHLTDMQTMQAALKDLYAVLTPEQRAIADQHAARMGGRGMGGPRG